MSRTASAITVAILTLTGCAHRGVSHVSKPRTYVASFETEEELEQRQLADVERKREAKAVVDAQARARRTRAQPLEPQQRSRSGGLERALRIVHAVAVVHAVRTGRARLVVVAPAATVGPTERVLYGGEQHDVYLGCLSCGEYDTDSVHSTFGSFGSAYQDPSIFSAFGEYGSKFSQYSPCSAYASEPPVIVDKEGRFYGRLTINAYHPQRSTDPTVNAWIEGVCEAR